MFPDRATRDRLWEKGVVVRAPTVDLVRDDVQSSWARSVAAGVSPALRAAPVELDGDGLLQLLHYADWLELAQKVLTPQLGLVRDSGHVLTLFDPHGLMLWSEGDPRVLERLQDIHFNPGANWSEAAAGTNGPGTALASGHAVHIIGAEHYCEAWHPWHCAAVPIRGPEGGLVGALDISGAQGTARPWSLNFAQLLAGHVEQALSARAATWRGLLLARFGDLASRYAGDLVAVVDAQGAVVCMNSAARSRGCPPRLTIRQGRVERASDTPLWLTESHVHEVRDGEWRLGAGLVAEEPRTRPHRRTPRPGTHYGFADLIGEAPSLTAAIALARTAAATALPVLILGESGVGKEVLAQAIHANSPRRDGPFIAVNCAALSRELVESELFGYEGGAFSGARPDGQIGRIQAADGGTLLLDEIGELPLAAQAALLRTLQESEITPVGGHAARPVDVRVLAATNRSLEAEVEAHRFRLDLFHRLAVVPITLPPLREHLEDLPLLVAHLRERLHAEAGLCVTLSPEVQNALRSHAWPGNVRELDNLLRRLAVVATGRDATLEDLPPSFRETAGRDEGQLRAKRLADVIAATPSMSEAAAKLGITRSTLYRQLERLGLKPKRTVARD